MSIQTAWKAYKSLDSEQKKFLSDQKFEASLGLEAWIAFLTKLTEFDRDADSLRKRLMWLGILTPIFWIVLAIVFRSGTVFWTGVALALVVWFVWWKLRSIDIPPSLDAFILPWLTLLREDVEPESEVFLRLDLAGNMAKGKRLDAISGKRNESGWKLQFFQDPWISGKALLADGNRLQWDIVDLLRQGKRSKTNARGKTKWKTKYKLTRSFDVHLTVRGKEYQLDSTSAPAGEFRTGIKTGLKGSVVRVRNQSVAHTATDTPELVELVQTVSQAYSNISLPPSEKAIG